MGSYSSFDNENIEVKDWEGLNKFFKIWNNDKPMVWEIHTREKMVKKNVEGKEYLTFESWDNIKLISYWYPQTCLFLKTIAPYIEGEVYWQFESNEEGGWVEFKDKKCIIHYGQMSWGQCSPDEIHSIISETFPKELMEDLQKLTLASSLG